MNATVAISWEHLPLCRMTQNAACPALEILAKLVVALTSSLSTTPTSQHQLVQWSIPDLRTGHRTAAIRMATLGRWQMESPLQEDPAT